MKTEKLRGVVLALAGWALLCAGSNAHATVIFSASGANTAAIQPSVDAFRAALGSLNANVAGSFGSGRREINWDGVPDALAAPNNLPANFFNVNSPRGVVFATPGTGFQVSANAATSTPVQFGNIDPSYPGLFEPFSAQRLFTALGSNIVDVDFFIPGSSSAAVSNGFGAVFSDVDLADTTSLTFFDFNNVSLGTFFVPSFAGNETFSFLGVQFDQAIVSRVRITNGNQILATGNTSTDLVVMDDFIYGEARLRVPEPSSLALLALGVALLGCRRRPLARS
jgi:hypothetical protein